MKEWWSARELVGAPGMPTTVRRVTSRAAREGWISRDREGRGGGREYHLSSLPETTRAELTRRWLAEQAQTSPAFREGAAYAQQLRNADQVSEAERLKFKEAGLARFEALRDAKKARARARLRILQARDQFLSEGQLHKRTGTELFAREYNAGRVVVADDIRALVPHVDRATIYRWEKAEREEGITGLVAGFGHNRGKSKIAARAEFPKLILGLMAKTPTIRPGHVYEYLKAANPELAALTSLRSVQRWMRDWKTANASIWLWHTNPDQWKSSRQVAFGDASEGIRRLNQLWELDSTPADVMLVDGRHSIIGVIDVYSRRAKLLVSKTSKATAVSTLLRRTMIVWGVPESARTDQGRDYTSQHVEDVLRSLDVEHLTCIPFASEQKPFIERFFRTFSHGLLELKPGFIGHNVAERKAIEARKSFAERLMSPDGVIPVSMSAAELQRFCDEWTDAVYAHAPHEGLGDKTPFQLVSEWREPVRRIEDERALDALLAIAPRGGGRTVTKKGIGVEDADFVAADLAAYVGQRVKVRLDPDDLGRIYVYEQSGEKFICIAECPERLGISRAKVAAVARARQKVARQEASAALREAKRAIKTSDIAEVVMDAALREAAKVVALPQSSEVHETAQLAAAADAVLARLAEPAPPPHDPEVIARGAKLIELREERRRGEKERERAEQEIYERYCALKTRDEESLSASEREWVKAMDRDPVIQGRLSFEKAFGLPHRGQVG